MKMRYFLLLIAVVLIGNTESSMIHNLGGPLATHPSAAHLYDLAFFFRLENTIPTNAFLKIKNPTGFVFQPTTCNYGIITEKTLKPNSKALKCEITFISGSSYINFLKADQTTAVGLTKNLQYGLWLQDNSLSTIDGSYGPFNVTVVSTNDINKVANEIVYDSNYEFGYIIVQTLGEPITITLSRDSVINNDVYGVSFNAVVGIDNPPTVNRPYRMKI